MTVATAFANRSLAQDLPMPADMKSDFETLDGPVLKVFAAKDEGNKFIAYVVKWKEFEVIVSDPLARSDFQVGDQIQFIAQKIDMPNMDISTLNFSILPSASAAVGSFGMKPGAAKTEASKRQIRIAGGELDAAKTEIERFYALNRAAKKAFKDGKKDEAGKLATELLKDAESRKKDWNYGNAIQDGNQVLGRIALANGDVEEAKKRLLASGESKGSPQMNSFGPNMQLAKELLEVKEKQVVLDYFDQCGKFWEMGKDKLSAWKKTVEQGDVPNFGANLLY
jgi:hypothetical protein